MSFLTALTGVESRATAINGLSLRDPALIEWFGGRATIAGPHITPDSALNISSWNACIRILTQSCAKLPLIVYERKADGGRDRAATHPLYKVLHGRANPRMSSYDLFQYNYEKIFSWGNSFCEIERVGGHVVALWPIHPSRVRIQVTDDRVWYYVTGPNGQESPPIRQEDILHETDWLTDSTGLVGISRVTKLRESLGLTHAEEEARARFFANDARPSGIIEYPGALDDIAYERYKKDWYDKFGGLGNKFRLAFMEQGVKYVPTQFSPEDQQFIEGRKFQKEEMAMISGVPLILLQGTEKATSWGTGIEQFILAYREFTIDPPTIQRESRYNLALFTEREREKYYCEALFDALLKTDPKSRAETLKIWHENGIISGDEWRAMENLNAMPNGLGKIYLVPANFTTRDLIGKQPPPLPATRASAIENE